MESFIKRLRPTTAPYLLRLTLNVLFHLNQLQYAYAISKVYIWQFGVSSFENSLPP